MAWALELKNLMELQNTLLQLFIEDLGAAYRETTQKILEGLKATLCEVAHGVETSPFTEEAGVILVEEFAENGRKTAKAALEVEEYIYEGEEKQADVSEGLYGLNELLQGTVVLFVLKCLQAGKGFQTAGGLIISSLNLLRWTKAIGNINSLMEDFRKGEG